MSSSNEKLLTFEDQKYLYTKCSSYVYEESLANQKSAHASISSGTVVVFIIKSIQLQYVSILLGMIKTDQITHISYSQSKSNVIKLVATLLFTHLFFSEIEFHP